MSDFDGKRIAVTGSAQGIGLQVAKRFHDAGAEVILIDLQADRLAAAEAEFGADGPGARSVVCDVSDEESVEACFGSLADSGGLDALVNAAGVLHVNAIVDTSAAAFSKVIEVNLLGTFLTMKYAAPLLRASAGAIVNFSSLAGKVGLESLSAYCASKAGVISLTHVAAIEFAPEVRANAVLPGIVDTEMQRREYEIIAEQTGKTEQEIRQDWIDGIPLKRLQEPDEIAEAVLFLASDRARSVTGQSLAVNGGIRMD